MEMFNDEGFKEMMMKYDFVKKRLETELEILLQSYEFKIGYNPVEHIKARIKSFSSAANKLKSKGLDVTVHNITRYIYDMVGMRIICSFVNEVYEIASIIRATNEFVIKKEIDYVKYPKSSGYRSYHMHVLVPIHLENITEYIEAEIQIRTVAMDCWASLDHKLRYKFIGDIPEKINLEIAQSASDMMNIDNKMQNIANKMRYIESNRGEWYEVYDGKNRIAWK